MVWNGCSFYVQKSKKKKKMQMFGLLKGHKQPHKQNFLNNILYSDIFLI